MGKKVLKSVKIRLNKFIADSGLTSRRKADQLIDDGNVKINGKKVFELGIKIDPKFDRVTIDGRTIKEKTNHEYYLLNKPQFVLTTMNDPEGRPTVADFTKKINTAARLFPVGRLDWDTEGLLIFTNDGDFAQNVSHPKSEIPKTYLVKVDGTPEPEKLRKLLNGISIIGGKVRAQVIERIQRGSSKKYSWLKVVITEGKNRQIRRMFEKIGFDVLKLQRVAIGQLRIGSLDRGQIKKLNERDLERVFKEITYESKIDDDKTLSKGGNSRSKGKTRGVSRKNYRSR